MQTASGRATTDRNSVTRRDLAVRVVAAVTLAAAAVRIGDSGSWSWALLGLFAALAGTNLGPSLVDNTGSLVTAGWWSRNDRLTLLPGFAAGLACSAAGIGFVVWILGELQVALRTLDRIVFAFIVVLTMLFIDYDRHKRRDLPPWVNRRTEQELAQPRSARGAFSLGAQLGSGSVAFRHSVAPHVVVVVAVLTNPGFVDSVVVCGVFGTVAADTSGVAAAVGPAPPGGDRQRAVPGGTGVDAAGGGLADRAVPARHRRPGSDRRDPTGAPQLDRRRSRPRRRCQI